MKYKTTNAEQKANNYLVLSFGYCDIQNIGKYLTANAYTCGYYGWKADFYEINGALTLSTGYNPLNYLYKNTKENQEKAYLLKKEIEKLEKNIEKGKYAFCKNHDYNKGKAFLYKKIDSLYTKIFLKH